MLAFIEPEDDECFSFRTTMPNGHVRISRSVCWELEKNILITLQQLAKAARVHGFGKFRKDELVEILRALDQRFI